MKIKIEKTKLINHLNNTIKAISNNTFLKSLQGMKIVASESNLKIITSNGSLSIKEVVEEDSALEIIEPGVILVPGKILMNIVKNLKGIIELTVEKDLLKISNNNFESHINLLDLNDYVVDSFETYGSEEFDIDVEVFRNLIEDVSYASSENEMNKVVLNGVNLSAYNGFLTASATNKFRLASKTIELNNNSDFNITILRSNLKHFIPIKASGVIKIFVDENKVMTRYENTTSITRLIEGSFPDIKNLIPNEYSKVLSVQIKKIIKVLDQATVLSEDLIKTVKLTISKDNMKIESRKKEIGETEINFNEFEYTGEPLQITFNYAYLKQALSNLDGIIQIRFNESNSIFSIENKDNDKFKQLILPLRSY